MSYRGYIPLMCFAAMEQVRNKQRQNLDPTINILEIGIENGWTLMPLSFNLIKLDIPFKFTAVDIRIKEGVAEQCRSTLGIPHKVELYEINSIEFLEKTLIQAPKTRYDIILVDGDHNYETVKKECELLSNFVSKDTVMIVDDFSGKYAHKDLYYADSLGYENNKLATPSPSNRDVNSPQGVAPAIQEYVTSKPELGIFAWPDTTPLGIINKRSAVWKNVIEPIVELNLSIADVMQKLKMIAGEKL